MSTLIANTYLAALSVGGTIWAPHIDRIWIECDDL